MDCARNIITANFSGGGTSATTAPLWQWDYGQALCITGIDLPAAFEVHFSTNRTGGVSTVAVGADGQVTIPNELLTIGKNLNAWIYLSDAQGEGETEYSILIPVKARPMPETYDAEVSGEFDDVVRQVSEYAQTAQTAADNAGASASAAAASADSAAASASAAEIAKTASETAQGKAEDAQAAAETAAQGAAASASAASASASSAGQAAISAGQSATAAAGSATTAENAAQTTTTKAGEASASATAANTAKTAAQTAQTGAETAATNAGQSASTASTKAAEAATSASNAAQSKTDAEAAATRAETAAASLTVDSALSDTSVNPVQNKIITGEVTQLKSAIAQTNKTLEAVFTLVDTTLTAAYSGYALNPAGYVRENSGYNVSQFINVENANGIIPDYNLRFTVDVTDYAGIIFFSSNAYGNPLKVYPYVDNGIIYPVPDGAKYVALTYTSGVTSKVTVLTNTDDLDTRVDALESDVSAIVAKVPDERQLYDNSDPQIFNGYCNGVSFYSSNAHRILYIPCKPNTYYTISADASLWVTNGVFTSPSAPANGGSADSFSSASNAVTVVENGRRYITNITASNANYLSVIYYNSNVSQTGTADEVRATVMITEGTERTEYVPYTIETKVKESALPDSIVASVIYDRTISSETASLSTGSKLEFNSPNIKKNNLITFSANIDTFGKLTIGQGRDALNQTAYIVIDATTVKVYRYTTEPVEWVSLNHGLTIADYIDVSIIVSNDEIGWAKLVLTSNGETYTYNRMAWLGCGNLVYAEATSGSYSNCVLKHSTTDYDKELWLMGDSYFDHWVTHALADGYKNFLCDGWSGRRSDQALNSLDILLRHGKPKYIVWCMGMNDGDSSSAVNANWKSAYDTLVALCDSKTIDLILCTIPNTPTVNNSFKNTIIRNSGYAYIDMAKAVGSDISTSWYTGLLSSDNVHPSTLGDQIIAKFMESAIPQIYGD